MPSPQPPLILVDNVYDRVNLYALATLSATAAAVVGREVQYVADYRRERTFYQAAASSGNPWIQTDLGAGNSAVVDSVWLDRGHNLWGRTVLVDGSTDGITWNNPIVVNALVVPAFGTVGGDPTTGWSVTEEGAIYTLGTNSTARRFWRFYDVGTGAWIITGVIMGKRAQLSSPAGWSSVLDEDAGDRSDRSESSLVPGYEGVDRIYSARTVDLKLAYIGAAEYDATIRGLRRTLFEVGQPAVIVMNYGTHPERAWLYRYSGKKWNSPATRSYRTWAGTFVEVGPLVR